MPQPQLITALGVILIEGKAAIDPLSSPACNLNQTQQH